MDGFKSKLKDSLQVQFSVWLITAILIVAVPAGIFSFSSAFDEAHELQDDMLRQIATYFDRQNLSPSQIVDNGSAADSDAESRIVVQYLPMNSEAESLATGNFELPVPLQPGFQNVEVNKVLYHVFVKELASGRRLAVAQQAALRDETARDSAFRTVMPLLILVPILLLIVTYLVRRLITPVATLSTEIDQRSEQQLQPFASEPLPREVRPFVVAFNRLLARVADSINAQKRFVADAAHELRSPLTALSLQAERLSEAEMSDVARERLSTLRQGIERGRALLEQLLTLSKAQSTTSTPSTLVSIRKIYQMVLEDLLPLAEAKNIDIGATNDTDGFVLASELDLVTVIRNLVDNAIRYTPPGGRVDLAVEDAEQQIMLRVVDTGPGIPPGELSRVFDPFYRVMGNEEKGSGLGLSIVRTIAERIGAHVELGYSDKQRQSGLTVEVMFPKPAVR